MTEDTKELAKEVFRSDMKTAEKMKKLAEENDPEDVSNACIEIVEELQEGIEDLHRERVLFATCFQIGNAIGSQQLAGMAQDRLEELKVNDGR